MSIITNHRLTGVLSACALMLGTEAALAADPILNGNLSGAGRYCSATAVAQRAACMSEVQDDHLVAVARCINVTGTKARKRCDREATVERKEGSALCREQRKARFEVCAALGEDRYDPAFTPTLFDDPKNTTVSNPYFPLAVGHRWEYAGGTETTVVEALDETKAIAGVTCLVVRDQVFKNGKLLEDTDDWFAQAKDGAVWYCGEETKEYETFAGDRPRLLELVSIDGAFKVGREGDKPGIISLAAPVPGVVYREEFSLSNAEDVAEVLSVSYGFGSDPVLDRLVPQQLAELLCAGDCVVTRNTNPMEPGTVELKYYARGIGFFLETKPEGGEVLQLVKCNFDPRCNNLPRP